MSDQPAALTPAQVLDLPMDPNDTRGGVATSVRGYLVAILAGVWSDEFTPKYGIEGSSDWRHRLYEPLVAAGVIPSPYDEDGAYMRSDDAAREAIRLGDNVIVAAIEALQAPVTRADLLASARLAEQQADRAAEEADRLRREASDLRALAGQ